MRASRPPRRRALRSVAVLATLSALLLPITLAGPASAGEKGPKPGSFRGGSLVQDGWWSRSNEPAPETGLLQPPNVPAPGAPSGTLPVALINGEPERIAALEFRLKGGVDTLVTQVLLAMEESDERGVNINADLATLQACPVTESFWVGVENGPWPTAPVYDCDAGVAPGVRDDDGVWTFDLTALAAAWTASDRDNSPAVVLVGAPPVDPTQGSPSFQVAFDGEEGVGLIAKVTSLPPDEGDSEGDGIGEDDGSAGSGTDVTTDEGAPDGGFTDNSGGGFDVGGGAPLGSADLGSLPAPDSSGVPGGDEPALPVAEVAPEPSVAAGPQALVSAAIQPWYGGLGFRSVALVIVALMLAYLVMIAMGGAGQPVVGARRRGVGRALERLHATRTRIITLEDRS